MKAQVPNSNYPQAQIDRAFTNLVQLSEKYGLTQDYKIIEQGCYCYYLNDATCQILEPWQILINTNEEKIIQSARFVEEANITLFASQSLTTKQSKTDIVWLDNDKEPVHFRYTFNQSDSEFFWETIGKNKQSQQQISVSLDKTPSPEFFPLLRIFTGNMVANTALTGSQNVIVPDIRKIEQPETLLIPYISKRYAKDKGIEKIHVDNQVIEAKRYQFLSDIYKQEDNANLWLNQQNRLVKYQWQQNNECLWRVELCQ